MCKLQIEIDTKNPDDAEFLAYLGECIKTWNEPDHSADEAVLRICSKCNTEKETLQRQGKFVCSACKGH